MKKRIAFIVEWYEPIIGGAGKQAKLQAKTLQSSFDIQIVTKHVSNAKKDEISDAVPIKRIGMLPNNQTNTLLFKLADYLSGLCLLWYLVEKRKTIDLIHVHGNIENNVAFASIVFAKLFSKPVIAKLALAKELTHHQESGSDAKNYSFFKKLNVLNKIRQSLALKLDHYIAISKDIESELIGIGIDKTKISYIPNGVDTNYFKPLPEDEKNTLRKKMKLPVNSTIFLVVSRLAKHKGIIDPLLLAWKKSLSSKEDMALVIVGGDTGLINSYETQIEQYIRDNALSNVMLVGEKDNTLPYYQAADYFVLPSENEGLSNALLEACACGLVPIVSDVSGSRDVADALNQGFVFNPSDSDTLVQALQEVKRKTGVFFEEDIPVADKFAKKTSHTAGLSRICVDYTVNDFFKKNRMRYKDRFEIRKISIKIKNLYSKIIP